MWEMCEGLQAVLVEGRFQPVTRLPLSQLYGLVGGKDHPKRQIQQTHLQSGIPIDRCTGIPLKEKARKAKLFPAEGGMGVRHWKVWEEVEYWTARGLPGPSLCGCSDSQVFFGSIQKVHAVS